MQYKTIQTDTPQRRRATPEKHLLHRKQNKKSRHTHRTTRQEPADTTRKHTPHQPEHHQKNSDVRRGLDAGPVARWRPHASPDRVSASPRETSHPPGTALKNRLSIHHSLLIAIIHTCYPSIIHTYHSYLLPVYHSYLSSTLATCLSFILTPIIPIIHTYHSYLLPVYHSYLSLILATCLSFILTPIIPIIHTFIITKTPPPGASGHNQETHATPARAPPEEQRR